MSEESNAPQPPPNEGHEPIPKIFWLFAAFVPSLIGVALLYLRSVGRGMLPLAVIADVILSVVAGVGLVRGMKNPGVAFILGCFLVAFFFVVNALIVLFVGCGGMGRIAP